MPMRQNLCSNMEDINFNISLNKNATIIIINGHIVCINEIMQNDH